MTARVISYGTHHLSWTFRLGELLVIQLWTLALTAMECSGKYDDCN
ncbi:MAG: hypothetical protein MK165_19415 [Pirellulaceae bacterium]|nr:hypothetical protein [Pirellulaceae bacterium]